MLALATEAEPWETNGQAVQAEEEDGQEESRECAASFGGLPCSSFRRKDSEGSSRRGGDSIGRPDWRKIPGESMQLGERKGRKGVVAWRIN